MTDCRHVTQYDGSPCANFNCAAASAAMVIFLGRAGAVDLTAADVRAESGRGCTPMDPPDATHSRSGGLYISDVQAVARAHGVSIDYNGGASWSPGTLRSWLIAGYAAIVLGNCQEAPISPTAGVVYHSAVVHDYDIANDTTHWHDPRLGAGVWIPVAQVEAYQLGFGGQRLAGFARDYLSLPEPVPSPAPAPAPAPEPDPTPPAPEPTTQPDPSTAPPVGGGSVVEPPPADGTPAEALSDHDRALLEGAGLIQDGHLLTRDQVVERFSQSPAGDGE